VVHACQTKKFCFWHFFEKKINKKVSKSKTILIWFGKRFRFANVSQMKTFSFQEFFFRFGNTFTFACKLKFFRFKNTNKFTFVSKTLSFRKSFLNKNNFV